MYEAIERFVPKVKFHKDTIACAWLTPELKKLKNRKNALSEKLKRKFDAVTQGQYNQIRSELLTKTRLAYQNHISTIKETFIS